MKRLTTILRYDTSEQNRFCLVLASLAICIAGVGAYWKTFTNKFIDFDDVSFIVSNSHVNGGMTVDGLSFAFTGAVDGNWIPLTWISHMLDVSLFGLNPGWHHGMSLLLHLSASVLLMMVFVRMTGCFWGSACVGTLFALHPLHVESVAWAAMRKDVLSGLFCMLTLLAYTGYARNRSVARYAAVVLLFALGLMAKPTLVVLPLLLLLLDFWPLERMSGANGSMRRLVAEKIPLLLLSVADAAVTYHFQKGAGAVVGYEKSPLLLNLQNAAISVVTYLYKFLLPLDLAVLYPFPSEIPLWRFTGSTLLLLALTAAAVVVRNKLPYILTGWLWFLIALLPVVGIIRVGSQAMADRYMYLPLAGLSLVTVWGARELAGRFSRRGAALCLALPALLFLASATWIQTGHWKDSYTLFSHALSVTEKNWLALDHMGTWLIKHGSMAKGAELLQESIRINPSDPSVYINLGKAYNNMGMQREAAETYMKAIEISPASSLARFNLALSLLMLGDMAGAEQQYGVIVNMDPQHAAVLRASIDSVAGGR